MEKSANKQDVCQWRWLWSKWCFHRLVVDKAYVNHIGMMWQLPQLFERGEGTLIHDLRNQLRILQMGPVEVVVKSFALPHWLNRFVYVFLRSSKAKRSFLYARMLRNGGFGSPRPVAYFEERLLGMVLRRSYYVCLRSQLPYTYLDVVQGKVSDTDAEVYLRAVGRFTARFHMADMLHKDYNNGNLLLGMDAEGRPQIEVIDLNRIRFRTVSVKEGCENMKHLTCNATQMRVLAESYAQERNADAEACLQWIQDAKNKLG